MPALKFPMEAQKKEAEQEKDGATVDKEVKDASAQGTSWAEMSVE